MPKVLSMFQYYKLEKRLSEYLYKALYVQSGTAVKYPNIDCPALIHINYTCPI